MKKRILSLVFTVVSILCVNAQEKLKINTNISEIKWNSDLAFYFGGHHGTVQFKEGYFIKTKDKITGGTFLIDMNTIANIDGGYNEGLVAHLKDPDFFDVKQFPMAKLDITSVHYSGRRRIHVNANLTIKGITKPVVFRGQLDFEKEEMKTKFEIDRTLWGITYNSSLKDNAIANDIQFEVLLSL